LSYFILFAIVAEGFLPELVQAGSLRFLAYNGAMQISQPQRLRLLARKYSSVRAGKTLPTTSKMFYW